MLVDVHAHLEHPDFKKDINQVIKRAKDVGVVSIINSGTCLEKNKLSLKLSEKYDIVNPSFGMYPLDAIKLNEKDLQKEFDYIKENKDKIIAIGEVGLDYSTNESIEKQKEIFYKVLKLAEKIKKPVLIHSRKAENDVLDILNSFKTKKVIMHCFTANMKLVRRASDLGFYFSIPPIITRLKHFQTLVEKISLKQLLTESDSPFLSPYKDKRNEPSHVGKTIEMISQIKKLEKSETEKIIFMNYQNFFKNF